MPGITVDLDGVYEKISEGNMRRGQFNMASRMLATMNENFVPLRDGDLRSNSSISADGKQLIWTVPYARKHYYTDFSPNYTTPGTGPHWDQKAKGVFLSEWIEAFKKGAGL